MENGQQNGAGALQARLNDPHTVEALTRLLDRIDTLEQTVDRLATLMEQGPTMLSMATDMADEQIRMASARGVDVEDRLRNALDLAEKLTAPEMVQRIDNLLTLADRAPGMVSMTADIVDDQLRQASLHGIDVEERLRTALQLAERLTAPEMVERLDQLLTLADQAPGLAAMTADIVDDSLRQAAANGVDVEARLWAGLAMAEKLTSPEMMAKLDQLLLLSDQAPGLAAMVADIADDTVRTLSANGVDINERIGVGLAAAERLTAPEASQALMTLLDPDLVSVVAHSGDAFKQSLTMPTQKIGLFGLLRTLNDPDMQRVLNLLLNFGRAFGRELDTSN